jgi:excisionase family DNA binding protein
MNNDLLTVREAAAQLTVPEGAVHLWLAPGRLPKVKCGHAVRIPAEAVEDFVRRHITPAKDGRDSAS